MSCELLGAAAQPVRFTIRSVLAVVLGAWEGMMGEQPSPSLMRFSAIFAAPIIVYMIPFFCFLDVFDLGWLEFFGWAYTRFLHGVVLSLVFMFCMPRGATVVDQALVAFLYFLTTIISLILVCNASLAIF